MYKSNEFLIREVFKGEKLFKAGQLFKGGKYSRAEIIRENTVCILCKLNMYKDPIHWVLSLCELYYSIKEDISKYS